MADDIKKDEVTDVEYTVEPNQQVNYYTVGKLRTALKDLPDDAPVVAAPLNEKIRVALDLAIAKDATLGEYKGDVAIFSTGLYDIETNREINLVAKE